MHRLKREKMFFMLIESVHFTSVGALELAATLLEYM